MRGHDCLGLHRHLMDRAVGEVGDLLRVAHGELSGSTDVPGVRGRCCVAVLERSRPSPRN